MAQIKPFQGILYNGKKAEIEKTVTPPYDVISPSMQERFYERDMHNIIRLILGKTESSDTPNNNRYTRAGKFLTEWLKKGILIKSKHPSIYVYTQKYLAKGKKRIRIGFIALMKIEDPKESGILPHEYTLRKPREDRLKLMVKTKANLSPIFSLFQDKENKINSALRKFIKSREPLFTVDQEGVTHKLWEMSDKKIINMIKRVMRDKKIFIADGHHRHEVALLYRNRMRKSGSFKKGMDYIMMYFSNLSEKRNIIILPTHRVVKGIKKSVRKNIVNALKKYFYVKPANGITRSIERLEKGAKKKHSFGMYMGRRLYILTLKEMYSVDRLIEAKKTLSLKKLDVTILHDVIINKILGVKNAENSVKYIRNGEDAKKLVDRGDYEAAFFLRPTDVMEMKAVAEKREMMPEKSTYFYPKLLTGLAINKF